MSSVCGGFPGVSNQNYKPKGRSEEIRNVMGIQWLFTFILKFGATECGGGGGPPPPPPTRERERENKSF